MKFGDFWAGYIFSEMMHNDKNNNGGGGCGCGCFMWILIILAILYIIGSIASCTK